MDCSRVHYIPWVMSNTNMKDKKGTVCDLPKIVHEIWS